MNKAKVILIDDEFLIRKQIRVKIETEELGIEIVGEYFDAKSALEEMEKLQPDVVISDICMPEMDGICFSELCAEHFPGTKVILITESNDFEYARRSIKAGVHDFLMKPVRKEELNTALKKAVESICQEREQRVRQKQLLEENKKNQILLRDMYLKNLLISDVDIANVENALQSYGINTALQNNAGVYVGILAVFESISNPEILGRLKSEVNAFFQGEKSVYIVVDYWGRLCVIYSGEIPSFEEYFLLLTQFIVQKWNYKLVFGISEKIEQWKDLPWGYKSAIQDMQYKHDENKESLRKTEDIHGNISGMEAVLEHIKEGKAEEAILELDCVWKLNCTEQFNTEEVHYQVNYLLAVSGEKKLREQTMEKMELSRCSMDYKRCLEYLIAELVIAREADNESEKGRMIRSIIQYLDKNFFNAGLSVNVLTEEFSVSRSYLNRLFKAYVGKTYSEFLSDLRYWKMLQYLNQEPALRDREIGEKIGIPDAHYLSIWFRKMTGYSVTEYRKLKK